MNAPSSSHGSAADRRRQAAVDRFVRSWGEMGSSWGINRSTAQIHALLLTCPRAMGLEEIVESLGVSRGNASMCLKELRNWGLVNRQSRPGDRRDYFIAVADAPAMFARIAAERKRREFDPALAAVQALLGELKSAGSGGKTSADAALRKRLTQMQRFMSGLEKLADALLAAEQSPKLFDALRAALGK